MKICKRVLYTGLVQGVGFRQTTLHFSKRHPVVGFVRNLPNGQVDLVAEGVAGDVDALLADIANRMGRNIERADVETLGTQDFPTFEIRR
ncbi:MAG: acylphosphatase [Gemmataceae bacterium]|nr:acylphosphatase [Gemmataceae bacterium]